MAFAVIFTTGLSPGAMLAKAADGALNGNAPGDALQVLADLTLIDGTCKGVTVNFGVVFRFAAQRGLAVSTIMPTGSQRSDFERVLQMRQAGFDPEELCGQVAANYAEALPGSVTDPSGRHTGRP